MGANNRITEDEIPRGALRESRGWHGPHIGTPPANEKREEIIDDPQRKLKYKARRSDT
jgi:hypothetical protein